MQQQIIANLFMFKLFLVGTGGWAYFKIPSKPSLKAYSEGLVLACLYLYIIMFFVMGAAEFKKEKAAKIYMEGKISISGAAEIAGLLIPEMVDYIVVRDLNQSIR